MTYPILQLFTGGGARFGYYLGSYAALVQADRAPHALLASCGGSLAAWLVSQVPEPKALYTLATSAHFYHAITSLCHSQTPPHRFALPFQAALRFWQTRSVSYLTQLHRRDTPVKLLKELEQYAVFQSLPCPHTWLNDVATHAAQLPNISTRRAPDILIFASRLIHENQQIKWQPVLFVPPHFADFRLPENPNFAHAPHRQSRDIHIQRTDDFQAAVAASVADMYYQKTVFIQNLGECSGGVIDLVPIELAHALAQTVFAESKPRYDRYLAEPAILRVFGTPANLRHAQVHDFMNKHENIHILPFAHNRADLAGKYFNKSYDWRSGCLNMDLGNADRFAEYMDAQWQYGYNQTIDFLEKNL